MSSYWQNLHKMWPRRLQGQFMLRLGHVWDAASTKIKGGSILATLCFVLLNCLLAMRNCRWSDKRNTADYFNCVSARSINTLFFCFFLKNNLRRINCTVMEVKYCHLSSKHPFRLLTFQLFFCASLCFSLDRKFCFCRYRLVLWLMQLFCAVVFWYKLPFFSLSCSIHSCLICPSSAYLNIAVLLIRFSSNSSKVNSSLSKLRARLLKCYLLPQLLLSR